MPVSNSGKASGSVGSQPNVVLIARPVTARRVGRAGQSCQSGQEISIPRRSSCRCIHENGSPIPRSRASPPLKLPDGLRLIVWPLLALEEWDMSRPMARMVISPPQGQPMLPDHPNWSWHEYGMRVGFWRMKRMFHDLGISPTVTLNARVCETYPQVAGACAEAGWELNAHGYDQVPMHKLEDQEGRDRQVGCDHHQVLGQSAARVVRAGADADVRYARSSVGGGDRIHRRTGCSTTSR